MSASYAWLITEDHITDGTDPEGTPGNAVGVEGPHDAPETIGADWTPTAFRMYDDDGILYYEGIVWSDDHGSEEACAGPLDDFGAPNAGCTSLSQFHPGNRAWETVIG